MTELDVAFRNVRPAVPQTDRRICTVVIDTEEDFDWSNPVQGMPQSTGHLRNLPVLAEILGAYGATPTYLLTYPVLQDTEIVAIIREQLARGACAVGLQLHPWVTPPFNDDMSPRASFLGNLQENQEEQKLLVLKAKFVACFGIEPKIFRAGRYGLSWLTPALLEKHGFLIDTSIAPRTNFASVGGPDFAAYDSGMFWFGEQRPLLELPLCRSIVGWGGRWATPLYQAMAQGHDPYARAMALMARLRFAERITLSPEGNDFTAMRRLVRGLLARGQTILPLSFHSSSLDAGRNPYVRTEADLRTFYSRIENIIKYMSGEMAFTFMPLEGVIDHVAPEKWGDRQGHWEDILGQAVG
jgi:hypothetical protein